MQPIGFVGIGNMGAPMVRCLAKSFPVLIYDVRHESTAPFRDAGPAVGIATSLAEVGAACHTVITMLPDGKVVRSAAFGNDAATGFASGLKSGAIVIDMSSSFPLDTRQLAEALATRGIAVVDAPVSGGVPKAVTGTLAIMAGGENAGIDRGEPLLRTMGTLPRTRPLRSRPAMK